MITKKRIKDTIAAAEKKGYEIKVRDIAFVVLCDNIEDKSLAYRVAYGEETEDADRFFDRPEIRFVNDYVKYASQDTDSKKLSAERMSFEENKRAMVQLIKDIEKAMEDGEMEKKDGFARIADIRVKLNDKFNVGENHQDRFIIVEPKFNFQCPHTGRECYVATKEDLMKKYGLVEKTEIETQEI